MATKAKESNAIEKEKKAPSSNSHTTTIKTKRTIKPSITITHSTNKVNLPILEKTTYTHLKPMKSSQPKSDLPNKPSLDKRRSLEKPLPSSNLTKQTQPSHSRLHITLVSSDLSQKRLIPRRCSLDSSTKNTNLSKPISDSTLKTQNDGKTKPLVSKSTNKTTIGLSTPRCTKKVANNNIYTRVNPIKTTLNIEVEQVKEVTSQQVEVIRVKKEEDKYEVEHVTTYISSDVDSEHKIKHVNSEATYDEVDDERIISTVPEVEEIEHGPLEDKEKKEEYEQEEENTNHDDGNNNSESGSQQEHYIIKSEVVVNKKEGEEGGVNITEGHNNDEEKTIIMEEKEAIKKAKVELEPIPSQQQLATSGQGKKKKSQVSNDVIEETANKLLARKNKVRALAGAFQSVIDHQTTS
ncbi:hypothetical protein RJT34_16543 [Clitoria ternatea]|uniref:Calmodulin-binding domain-containing protein n=1 Tax=Clitoria ternatea TaxID=43366 RepID=A0AAN9J8V2_CLITE